MKKSMIKPLTLGSALILTAAVAGHSAANPFSVNALDSGYQVADKHGEGSCGEGSCGGHGKKAEGSCGEGSCGHDKKSEGSCGEGSCGH